MNRRWAATRRRLVELVSVAGLALAVGPASAATEIYHSPGDDGISMGGPVEIDVGPQLVFVYIDGGPGASVGGTVCDTGAGDELCGFQAVLTGVSGLTLTSFTPDAGADIVFALDGLELRVNGLDSSAPAPGPKRIGELLVNAVGGGELTLTAAEAIHADLSSEALAVTSVVAVPEPAELAMLASGIACLCALGRRRGRRR